MWNRIVKLRSNLNNLLVKEYLYWRENCRNNFVKYVVSHRQIQIKGPDYLGDAACFLQDGRSINKWTFTDIVRSSRINLSESVTHQPYQVFVSYQKYCYRSSGSVSLLFFLSFPFFVFFQITSLGTSGLYNVQINLVV